MTDRARLGRRNQVAGDKWRDDCVRWLNEHGWPGAGYQLRAHSNDLTGTWDLAVETTITTWDKIWGKLDQARDDARHRHLTDFCVWKKRNRSEVEGRGSADPGKSAVLMTAERFFPLVMRLEELERREMDAEQEFKRGFRLGLEAQREAV